MVKQIYKKTTTTFLYQKLLFLFCSIFLATSFFSNQVNAQCAVSLTAPANVCSGSAFSLKAVSSGTIFTSTNNATTGLPLSVPDPATLWPTTGAQVTNTIPVSGIAGTIANASKVTIKMNLAHTWCGDMIVELVTPSGAIIPLIYRLGATSATAVGSSADFVSTNVLSFNSAAAAQISTASSPIATGTFLPSCGTFFTPGNLGLLVGENYNGNWSLRLADGAQGDFGTLSAWSISFVVNIGNYTSVFSGGSGAISTPTYTGTNQDTAVVNITGATAGLNTYTVTSSDGLGCTSTSTVSVNVNAPVVTASVSNPIICLGSSTTFTGGGAATYTWSDGTNTPTNAIAFTPPASGTSTYIVTGTDANMCSATSSVSLIVNPFIPPTLTASVSPSPVCLGSSTTFTGGGAATYTWSDGTNTPSDAIAFTPPASGTSTYTVTGTDANMCSATSSVSLTVNPITTFNAPITLASSCPTNTGGSVVVSAASSSTFAISPSGPTQPSNGVFASMTGGTNYMVTLTDANMCTNTTMISATLSSNGELANATATNASSTAGNACGILTQNDNSTLNYYGASCDDLIATITDASGGNVLGSVNACVTVMPTVPTYNGQPYLPRTYDITPTNQGAATIVLYYTQDDFDDYNAAAGSFPQIPAVQGVGTATFCISQVPAGFLPGASGATTVVHTVTATWNAAMSRWEVVLPVASFSGFYCHACNPLNSALPASIANFKGTKTATSDLLTWSTTSELNNASFTILYSNDGKNYARLTSVNSKAVAGNSNVVLNYSAENSMPKLGHNYYKLEQVDIDGKSLINTQVVDLMWGANGNTVSVYPNPTTAELNIDIYTTKAENSTIKVLDMSGRILKEVQTKLQSGANSIQLNIGELATGIYTIQILENNKISQVSKVEKK